MSNTSGDNVEMRTVQAGEHIECDHSKHIGNRRLLVGATYFVVDGVTKLCSVCSTVVLHSIFKNK